MARNTKLLILGLALFTTIVVGVNFGKNSYSPPQTTEISTPTTVPTPSILNFRDPICGVSFEYPDSFIVTVIDTGGALFTDTNSKESLSLLCQKSFPTPTGTTMTVTHIPIGSSSATLYRHVSTSQGGFADKLLFTHPKNKLQIYIAGQTAFIDTIIRSLSL